MVRAEMVENGLQFLRHPNVQTTPLSQRVSFLEQKGMTKDEIQAAIERYQSSETPGAATSTATTVQAAAPVVMAAAGPVQELVRRGPRRLPRVVRVLALVSSVVGAATILGICWQWMLHSGYFPWFRSTSQRRLLAAAAKEEEEEATARDVADELLHKNLEDVSAAIQAQTSELSKLCAAVDKKESELLAQQRASQLVAASITEQSTVMAIAVLKAEVSTLKALVLSTASDGIGAFTSSTVPKQDNQSASSAFTTTTSPVSDLSSLPSSAAPLKETPAQRMESVLRKFRLDNSLDQLKAAAGILIMYVKNLVENPDVPRYRRIAPANVNFKQKIEPLKHHDDLLKAIGFESTGLNMEWKWHLLNRENGEFEEHLAILRALLKALQAISSSRGDIPVVLEDVAHQSMRDFYNQRKLATQEQCNTSTSTSVPHPKETDLEAFLTRLEQKTAKPFATETVSTESVRSTVESSTPAPPSSQSTDSTVAAENGAENDSNGPAYPKSFLEVMELVKKGEKVPGIQEIEDRISEDASKFLVGEEEKEDGTGKRTALLKPWEKQES